MRALIHAGYRIKEEVARRLDMTVFYRRLPRFEYLSPRTIDEALNLLGEYTGEARVLAGGTDLVPQLRRREAATPKYVINIKAVPNLDTIHYDEQSGLTIGALTTIHDVAESPIVRSHYPGLAQAASQMASPQVRNRGTIMGNICNAVPSADSAPSLLALEAVVVARNKSDERVIPMSQFFAGPRKTNLAPGEIAIKILIPKEMPSARSVYLKLSPRHSMDLAVVGVAVAAACRDGICDEIRIGLGAVAPTPIRASRTEAMLRGKRVTTELIDEAARNAVTECSPIDDHRASREYRSDMVYVLAKRALTGVLAAGGSAN